MPPERSTPTVAQVFARRLQELRNGRGWTQSELARRVKDLGGELDRAAIAKIELAAAPPPNGRKLQPRRVRLEEALVLAAALGVSPLQLLVPESEQRFTGSPAERYAPGQRVKVGDLEVSDFLLLNWLTGELPLRREDVRTFNERRELPRWGAGLVEVLVEFNLLGALNEEEREALLAAVEADRERKAQLLRDASEPDAHLLRREQELAAMQKLLEERPRQRSRRKP